MQSSNFTHVVVDCTFELAEPVSELVENFGADSTSLSFPDQGRCQVAAIFNKEIADRSELHRALHTMRGDDETFCVKQETLPDRDWALESQLGFKPLQIGKKLWIRAPWHNIQVEPAKSVVITPGMSFGTGHHPTTQMCLEFLCDLDLENKTIIDYGCGSGILAISALALGARKAWGIDIDPEAVSESEANAKRNGVSDRYHACLSAEAISDHSVDVIVANLYSKALIESAAHLLRLARAGGWIAISGILADQIDVTMQAFRSIVNHSVRQRGEWAAVVMRLSR